MSREWIATDDEGTFSADNLATQKWLEGHEPGAKQVVIYLRKRASALFDQDKTQAAIDLRALAKEIEADVIERMRADASAHLREYPWRIKAVPK